ncbi:MAG: hemolysin III family protein [Ruminococcaceae bacterium]|nr:hemolysin III family protein [Oscillospiraceae bacterium]
MKRTKLSERLLPEYTKGEEIFNTVSHIIGGVLGIVTTVLCVIFAAIHKNVFGIVSGALFGSAMIILYTISSIYHGLRRNLAKKVFQIIDHCSIFILIAGTYTPFALCVLREYNSALGWSVFGLIWALSTLGITLNAIDLKRFNVISMILYLGMGWCIIFTSKAVFNFIGSTGFILLLSGGVSYTVGAILYGLGRKHRYMHSIFHVFVVLGSLLHFLCVLLYIM